jgi:hypothetical protein
MVATMDDTRDHTPGMGDTYSRTRALASQWRCTTRLEVAEGAAWAPSFEHYAGGVFDARLDEMLTLAGKRRADIEARIALFKKWKRGDALVGPDGRLLVINLAEHIERVERVVARDRIVEPPIPREVLDRGGF